MKRAVLLPALLLAACGGDPEPAPQPSETAEAPVPPALPAGELPPQVADFPALASKDCAEVAGFYFEALASREYAQAALVWDDPVIDGARLEAVFGGYREAHVEAAEPAVEGAAGSLYCTVTGTLTDAADPARPPLEGELTLRRVNDVPGATPDQLRWTLRSSTFVEKLERSTQGQP
jgi:hypothetical protein